MFLSAGTIKNSGWVIAGLAGSDILSVSLSLLISLFYRPKSFYPLFFFFPFTLA